MRTSRTGEVFSLLRENAPTDGCTVSERLWKAGEDSLCCFSLFEGTDISAERHANRKLLHVLDGRLSVCAPALQRTWTLRAEESLLVPADTPVGMRTETGTVYTEWTIGGYDAMNEAIRAGEIFALKDLVPYRDGKIVNRDVLRGEKMKFVVMAFDAGTGLDEHAAPGDALLFALEGKAIIGCEGEKHAIRAGENFRFAKDDAHWIQAAERFKMALLLTLD